MLAALLSFPEKYEVKVSDKEDKWSNYDTELAVDREPEFVQSRGIDLGKYKDKDIYVAINVKSLPGEANRNFRAFDIYF